MPLLAATTSLLAPSLGLGLGGASTALRGGRNPSAWLLRLTAAAAGPHSLGTAQINMTSSLHAQALYFGGLRGDGLAPGSDLEDPGPRNLGNATAGGCVGRVFSKVAGLGEILEGLVLAPKWRGRLGPRSLGASKSKAGAEVQVTSTQLREV